jgi:hypothetical protein
LKYCLKNRQTKEYLQKADEIKAEYRDYKSFPDTLEDYPNATLICQIYVDTADIDWEALRRTNILAQGRFICCVATYEQMLKCKELDIKFYYGYPITTFQELRTLKQLGACYVRLGAPLFFQMDKVKEIGVPVRLVPNVAHLAHLPMADGVTGTWVRPEDVVQYEPYCEAIEFEDCDREKEQALFRIYAEDRKWPGSMDLIITNLNYKAANRFVHPDAAAKRLTCGQRCMENGICHLCYRWLQLADADTFPQLVEKAK